jgi:hypothetical protein
MESSSRYLGRKAKCPIGGIPLQPFGTKTDGRSTRYLTVDRDPSKTLCDTGYKGIEQGVIYLCR